MLSAPVPLSRGNCPGPVFAFEGTRSRELKAVATLVLQRQDYADRGAITVISDGEECLKRLSGTPPQPATHVLDWFYIKMMIQPFAQLAAIALTLMKVMRKDLRRQKMVPIRERRADKHLGKPQTYIRRNRGEVVNYGARLSSAARIATSLAEATVNRLVATRFVKKQQMRWSRTGALHML